MREKRAIVSIVALLLAALASAQNVTTVRVGLLQVTPFVCTDAVPCVANGEMYNKAYVRIGDSACSNRGLRTANDVCVHGLVIDLLQETERNLRAEIDSIVFEYYVFDASRSFELCISIRSERYQSAYQSMSSNPFCCAVSGIGTLRSMKLRTLENSLRRAGWADAISPR